MTLRRSLFDQETTRINMKCKLCQLCWIKRSQSVMFCFFFWSSGNMSDFIQEKIYKCLFCRYFGLKNRSIVSEGYYPLQKKNFSVKNYRVTYCWKHIQQSFVADSEAKDRKVNYVASCFINIFLFVWGSHIFAFILTQNPQQKWI